MGSKLVIRAMRQDEWEQVAELIHISLNYWYEMNLGRRVLTGPPAECVWYCKVYEALDPGCCLVAEDGRTHRLLGSCFYHPRSTHVALGIMNAHPSHFGRGVAKQLLNAVIEIARGLDKPLRLVSSAMNLDSFSLYTRAGFVPRQLYQDLQMPKPLADSHRPAMAKHVRPATLADVPAMVTLEHDLIGVERQKDFEYFVRNEDGIWHTLVAQGPGQVISGFLVSVSSPSNNMLGPGVMRDEQSARGLIWEQLKHRQAKPPIFVVPADATSLIQELYRWGARNTQLHIHSSLGDFRPMRGINMPTFMPETA